MNALRNIETSQLFHPPVILHRFRAQVRLNPVKVPIGNMPSNRKRKKCANDDDDSFDKKNDDQDVATHIRCAICMLPILRGRKMSISREEFDKINVRYQEVVASDSCDRGENKVCHDFLRSCKEPHSYEATFGLSSILCHVNCASMFKSIERKCSFCTDLERVARETVCTNVDHGCSSTSEKCTLCGHTKVHLQAIAKKGGISNLKGFTAGFVTKRIYSLVDVESSASFMENLDTLADLHLDMNRSSISQIDQPLYRKYKHLSHFCDRLRSSWGANSIGIGIKERHKLPVSVCVDMI